MTPTRAAFPAARLRRTRRTPALRALVRETALVAGDLIWPLFLCEGEGVGRAGGLDARRDTRLSPDLAVEAAPRRRELGIPAICLFPYTDAGARRPRFATRPGTPTT